MRVVCDHLHLRSPDPEAAAQGYAALFGATVADRVAVPKGVRLVVDLGGLRLFIDQVPAETAGPPEESRVGIEHIGLAVADLDAAAAELRGHGARFTLEPTEVRPGVKIAFLDGPDRVRIELVERAGQ
jgi:catechol 2,3-dioxygenase-like lactoylglutathione lyase family enzyme